MSNSGKESLFKTMVWSIYDNEERRRRLLRHINDYSADLLTMDETDRKMKNWLKANEDKDNPNLNYEVVYEEFRRRA